MKIILAIVFFIHGFAHLVGFIVPWRLAELKDMPYKTTILFGTVDLGENGARLVGLLWLLTAAAFFLTGIFIITQASFVFFLSIAVALFSFSLCIIGLPDSRIGVFVNIAILIVLMMDRILELRWFFG